MCGGAEWCGGVVVWCGVGNVDLLGLLGGLAVLLGRRAAHLLVQNRLVEARADVAWNEGGIDL